MSVLLIGSTGMGKSTFGNYLFDPNEDHMFDNQTFAAATDNKPLTQEVKAEHKEVQFDDGRSEMLGIIDTPGLNESAEKDLSHMIDIIKHLNECEEIRACILVVKFNAKIDAQYKATLEYYSRLLPGLFEKNVVIVMTEFATNEYSVRLRQRQRINVEEVKQNTISELRKCSNKEIMYSPQVFMIDCLPLNDAEMETSVNERSAILDYIFQLPTIQVTSQMIAKTDYIKQIDGKKYEQLQGEIIGYNSRLKEVYTNSQKALDDTQAKEMEITQIESKINNLETKLRNKDTTEDVVAEHVSIDKDWKLFRTLKDDFCAESRHEITKHKLWTNGKCKFTQIIRNSHSIRGKVEGKFSRGIHASVTVYTEKKRKHSDEIAEFKTAIAEENANLTQCKEEWKDFRKLHAEKLKEIELLQNFIADRRTAAKRCCSDLMTMEEAILRLKKTEEI